MILFAFFIPLYLSDFYSVKRYRSEGEDSFLLAVPFVSLELEDLVCITCRLWKVRRPLQMPV